MQAIPSLWVIYLALILFCIGVFGVMIRRNILIIMMCIELMINAVMLIFVTISRSHFDISGQIMVFFVMLVAAAEVAVGLVIVSGLYKKTKSVDVDQWCELKE